MLRSDFLLAAFRSSPALSFSAGTWWGREPKWAHIVCSEHTKSNADGLRQWRKKKLTDVDLAGTAYLIQPVTFIWASNILSRTRDDAARAIILYSMNGQYLFRLSPLDLF